MNKVLLTGRMTKDPEIRYTTNGMANLMFTLAVDKAVRDQNGQRQADYISCVAWGQQADFISRYITTKNMLAITGRIQTRNYQGQDNQVHYVTEVVVEAVENMTPKGSNQAPGANQQPQQQPQANPYQGYNNPTYGQQRQATPYQQPTSYQQPQQQAPSSFNVDVSEDDLPF